MNSVTVATFHEEDNAESLRKRLEDAGIKTLVHDERRLQRYWFMSKPLAGVKLKVAESQEEKARKLLQKWHAEERVLKYAILCPECGSPDVEYPQMTRKFMVPSLLEILFALGFLEREFYCYHCHYVWPTKERLDVERDPLGWPVKHRTPTEKEASAEPKTKLKPKPKTKTKQSGKKVTRKKA